MSSIGIARNAVLRRRGGVLARSVCRRSGGVAGWNEPATESSAANESVRNAIALQTRTDG